MDLHPKVVDQVGVVDRLEDPELVRDIPDWHNDFHVEDYDNHNDCDVNLLPKMVDQVGGVDHM